MAEKIGEAIDAYQARFGARPTLVWVHPSVALDLGIADVLLEQRVTVAPNTIWVGMQLAATP